LQPSVLQSRNVDHMFECGNIVHDHQLGKGANQCCRCHSVHKVGHHRTKQDFRKHGPSYQSTVRRDNTMFLVSLHVTALLTSSPPALVAHQTKSSNAPEHEKLPSVVRNMWAEKPAKPPQTHRTIQPAHSLTSPPPAAQNRNLLVARSPAVWPAPEQSSTSRTGSCRWQACTRSGVDSGSCKLLPSRTSRGF